ncbi:MAG: P63C domain-containing protein [Thermoguttaceae bacterium]
MESQKSLEGMSKEPDASEAARVLSNLGASKGGKARAAKLTAEQLSESGRKAALARWAGDILIATHGSSDHPLKIGEIEIPCYVLADGRRVLAQNGMIASLDMKYGTGSGGGADRLVGFIGGAKLSPFIPNDLRDRIEKPLRFKTTSGSVANGYEATILADLCDAVLAARNAGVLQKQQMHIAHQCEILMRAFAKVGIIALVDEITGYQEDRARDALVEILRAFISEELRKWIKTFPDEYFRELCRLRGIPVGRIASHHPQYIGHLTNDVVYRRLAPGVLKRLKEVTPKNPKGARKHKFFQRLTEDIGDPALRQHLASVITLMKVSDDWKGFYRMLNKALPKYKEMPLLEWAEARSELE